MKTNAKRILTLSLALVFALSLATAALASVDDGLATRGDVVKYLYAEYGNGAEPKALNAFTDVPADSGVAAAAAWAAGLGIARGYGDGRFGPDDLVTREQAATMIYRLAQHLGQGFQGMWMFYLDYPDAGEISEWADEAMHWVVMKGVITERDAGLAPRDHIGVNELPVWIAELGKAMSTTLESGGYILKIPVGIAGQLHTDLPEEMAEGTLFTVSEQASIDAAEAMGYDGSSYGWLFAIEKISDERAHELLCQDMSGMQIFAMDEEGNHFLFRTPTDVRFFRETTEQMYADSAVWTALNEWAAGVKDSFINDNGLIPEYHGNSEVDIALYRTAYKADLSYTLSTLEFGPLEPAEGVDAKEYVFRALEGVKFNFVEGEGPDGEYLVLNFPGEEMRFDFFRGSNTVRRVSGDFVQVFEAVYDDGVTVIGDIMNEWYDALAAAHGLK